MVINSNFTSSLSEFLVLTFFTHFMLEGSKFMGCAVYKIVNEPRSEKTGLRGFRPGPTQTGLGNHRRLLETRNFGFRK